jgi:hypothetical protein
MQHVPNISGLENAPLQTQAMNAKWFQQNVSDKQKRQELTRSKGGIRKVINTSASQNPSGRGTSPTISPRRRANLKHERLKTIPNCTLKNAQSSQPSNLFKESTST